MIVELPAPDMSTTGDSMDGSVMSMPLTEAERRILGLLGGLRPEEDDGTALALLAGRVQSLRDAGGLGVGIGPDVVRGLASADGLLCLLLASHPARERRSVIERARLFHRHRGVQSSRVGLFILSALEADRRRLGMRSRDLGV